jgi:hypothetical protein
VVISRIAFFSLSIGLTAACTGNPKDSSSDSSADSNSEAIVPVHVGFMIHMEDDWGDHEVKAQFETHAEALRYAAELHNNFGGKFTAESAIPFAEGCETWGDNVLQSMLDAGMGVGSHANNSAQFVEIKGIIDELVGAENNRGISGGSQGGFVVDSLAAGFEYKDALVFSAYKNVPVENRPDQVTDQEIDTLHRHEPAPPDLTERTHPHRVNSSATWPTDTTGDLLLLTGSLGTLHKLEEGGMQECGNECDFNQADIDRFIQGVKDVVALAKTDALTVVYAHTPLELYKLEYEGLFVQLFEGLQPLVDSGEITWSTHGEMYDAFLALE